MSEGIGPLMANSHVFVAVAICLLFILDRLKFNAQRENSIS
jgi:hypothetical protein